MTINATLLIQAFHFGIIYYALRILVLKPAYSLIQKERDIYYLFQEHKIKAENDMRILQEKRYKIWYTAHRFFVHTLPQLAVHTSSDIISQSINAPVPIDDSTIPASFVKDLTHILVDRLKECR